MNKIPMTILGLLYFDLKKSIFFSMKMRWSIHNYRVISLIEKIKLISRFKQIDDGIAIARIVIPCVDSLSLFQRSLSFFFL